MLDIIFGYVPAVMFDFMSLNTYNLLIGISFVLEFHNGNIGTMPVVRFQQFTIWLLSVQET